jgi:sarcosine oxidase subunit gamma
MVDLTAVAPRSIAGIGSFRDTGRLCQALRAEFGAAPPEKAGFIQAGAITLARIAPARFLAAGPADADLAARLAKALEGLAAVTDQSDMWSIWRVSGPGVRDCLARVVPIDLATTIFQVGDLALTRAGHLDVRLCRIETDAYEIAGTRSMADDLLHALESARKDLPK